ncbi:PP2C family protein-serine/threonine phosphatase [Leptospira idonii]|uniref:Serine/threonine-protein phosphatase n=1 Tax=Leptospira idonii TaxID=1193500 RepID=A0A4R9LZK2_9LEPT|nr:PP2C family protein-serine/threonine phosphatase [Leptospira idonii]TGN19192.1 serine/threonine-protein phosphatase [Leptospira idonii]
MSQTLYKYFHDLFKKPNRTDFEIIQLVELKYDREYIFYTFIIHFIAYFLLILPPFFSFRAEVLPYLLGITIARLVLLLQSYTKIVNLGFVIYVSGFIADALLYIAIAYSIHKIPSLENYYLANAYLMVFIIPILLFSFRVQRSACLYPGFFLILFHCVYIYFLPDVFWDETTHFSKIFPIITFAGTSLVGSVFILNKRKNITDLYRLSEERRYIQQELELAKKVQDALFPKDLDINGLKYKYYRKNPNLIGGDFFDFVQLREGNVGVFLTDVAGHGISSAMVASIMKVLVSTIPYRFKLSPSKLLEYLDERLAKDLNKYHASAIYVFFDFIEKKMNIGNAGHPYIIHCPKDGSFQEIETEGAILGFNIRSPIVYEKIMEFQSGDRFVIYTDGLIESTTSKGVELGADGFLQILNKNKELRKLQDLEISILHELKSEFGIESFSDDTMFLLLEVD